MRGSWRAFTLRYGFAAITVALAIGGRLLMDRWLGNKFVLPLPLFAIVITARFGGLRPALFAVSLGAVGAAYFLLEPRWNFAVEGADALGLLIFLTTGLGIALLGGSMHEARQRADDHAAALRTSNDHLEARVLERTAELQQKAQTLESEVSSRRARDVQLKLLETCINRLNDIVLITEAEPQAEPGPRIIYVNDAFVRRTGYTREEAIGRSPRMLQGPKTDRVELGRIRQALLGWKPVRAELINYTKTGDEFWLDLDIMPVADPTGWFTHWVAVERDITDRKLAEEESARLAAIVQSSDDAIIGKDLDGIVTSWNAGAEKIFGYTAQEMVGQPLLKLIPPERHHEEIEILTQVRRGENIRHFDTVRQRKNGLALEVSVTISPIKDSSGRIIGVSKVARDIHDRIQAAHALQQREAEFRTLAETMPQIVWVTKADGANIYFNQRWMDYTGLTLEESLGNGWNKPFHPEDRNRAQQAWEKAVAGVADYSLECRLRSAKGEYRWWWILAAPFRAADGTILKWFGTCTDITDRKRTEELLRDSEIRFRTMANSMSQLAWIAEPDGYISWYNQRWYEYTGTTPAQMEGWGWQSVHDPQALPRVMERWQAAIASGEPFEMEFPLRGADGRLSAFLTRGQPLKDSAGRVAQWFGTNTDVDELKRAEEEIRQLNAGLEQRVLERTAQLEAANKELEAFSYSVSHDLRAPLRAVNGFAGMVLTQFADQLPEAGKHYLDRIQKGGLRMGQLIDDLLAFSRLNRQSVTRRTVETDGLVQALLDDLKPQPSNRQLEICINHLPPCFADPDLLRQVWINLITNAIKYTSGRMPAIVEIGSLVENGEVVYFVHDNGAGFDMRFAHKLFGVFQRLHRADEFEGTGVGLAIVQRIIHRHGGRVWAQAEVNRGATFFFTLEQPKPS